MQNALRHDVFNSTTGLFGILLHYRKLKTLEDQHYIWGRVLVQRIETAVVSHYTACWEVAAGEAVRRLA